MKWTTWLVIGISLMFLCVLSGCSNDDVILIKSDSGTINITNNITTLINNTYYINTTNNITYYINVTNNITNNITSGGSGVSFFDLIDRDYYYRNTGFESVTAGYNEPWVPTAIASGTTAVGIGAYNHPATATMSCGTPANSGYAYQISGASTYLLGANYVTVGSFKVGRTGIFFNSSNLTANDTYIRFGFMDVFTVGAVTDGVYFNISHNEIETYRRRATFIEYGVGKYQGHLAKEYKERKIENYLKEMEEMEEDVDIVTYSLNKTCKILGVSDGTIRKCIEAKVISPEWNATGTKMRLRQEDIDKLKIHLKPQEV